MSLPVFIRPIAKIELEEAIAWYEKEQQGVGLDFKDAVHNSFSRIATGPLQFPVIYRDVRRALLRRFPYGIYFIARPNAIIVIAIFHGKRNPKRLEHRT